VIEESYNPQEAQEVQSVAQKMLPILKRLIDRPVMWNDDQFTFFIESPDRNMAQHEIYYDFSKHQWVYKDPHSGLKYDIYGLQKKQEAAKELAEQYLAIRTFLNKL